MLILDCLCQLLNTVTIQPLIRYKIFKRGRLSFNINFSFTGNVQVNLFSFLSPTPCIKCLSEAQRISFKLIIILIPNNTAIHKEKRGVVS